MESLKYVHASLVNDKICVSQILVKKVEVVECDTCPTLKTVKNNYHNVTTHIMFIL